MNKFQNIYLCPKVCAVTAGCMEYVPGNVRKMDQTQIVYTTFVNTLVSETTYTHRDKHQRFFWLMLEIIIMAENMYIPLANIISITVDWLQSSHLFVVLALSEHSKTSLQMSSIRLPLRTGDVNLYFSLPSVTTSGVTSDRLPTKSFSLYDTHYMKKVIIKSLLKYYHNDKE